MSGALEAELDRLARMIATEPDGFHDDDLVFLTGVAAGKACRRAGLSNAATRTVLDVSTGAAMTFGARLSAATAVEVALLRRVVELTGDPPEVALKQLLDTHAKEA